MLEPNSNGNIVIDDMILSYEQYLDNFVENWSNSSAVGRAGIPGGKYRWTNGEIPFMFWCGVNYCWKAHEKRNILKTIRRINQSLSPCIKIRYTLHAPS